MKPQSALPLVVVGLAAKACLLPGEVDGIAGHDPKHLSRFKRQSNASFVDFPIGKGDRFAHGRIAPRGLGLQERDLASILNVDEVESGLRALAGAFDDVELFTAPHQTFEKRRLYGITTSRRPRVLIQSGVHARERGGPDHALYFVGDLVAAGAARVGLRYGNRSYTAEQIRTALSAGVVLLPLTNPDGVAHDQAEDSCWRKNRNPGSASAGDEASIGIDLNRNFGVLWDYKRLFSPLARRASVGSDSPRSPVFHGTAPQSEPETRDVAWVYAQHAAQLSWSLDLHSFGGDILYGWGDDDMQTTDPSQSFANAAYDGSRGHLGADPPGRRYREYMEAADLRAEERVARRMGAAMTRAGGVRYEAAPVSWLYPVGGSSIDHALGQYYGRRCGAARVHGLVVEFGWPTDSARCLFYPDAAAYHEAARQVAVGLMELLLAAAGPDGAAKVYRCAEEANETETETGGLTG